MPRQLSDFLLKGGRLIDPASGRDGLFDVRGVITDGGDGTVVRVP